MKRHYAKGQTVSDGANKSATGSYDTNGYEIGTVEEYEDACRVVGRNVVSEIRHDWELVEKEIAEREKSRQSKEDEEVENRENALSQIVIDTIINSDLKSKEVMQVVHQKYNALDMPKGNLTIRKMNGVWRVKVSAKDNPHLDLDYTV